MKICTGCGEAKSLDQFFADRRRESGRMSRCKSCKRAACREWRKATNADQRRYQLNVVSERERHLLRKYGVSLARYAEMLDVQGGACAIGHAGDDAARLRAAAEYLETPIVPQVAAEFVRACLDAAAGLP